MIIQLKVDFLDTKIILENGRLSTDLFVKPTDTHSYLHYTSAHPTHCKQSGPYSQLIRIKRICTTNQKFLQHQLALVKYYLKRGYPEDILLKNVQNIENLSRQDLLYPEKSTEKPTPRQYMVMTYSPCNPKIIQIIRKHWHMLQYSSSPKQFTAPPMVSYRKGPTMKDTLVSARVKNQNMDPKPPQPPPPKCIHVSCIICKYLNKSDRYTSKATKRSYKLNTKYTPCCQTKNIIYMITCYTCKKQYVGETKRSLEKRMKEHQYDIKSKKDKPVSRHMLEHKSNRIDYQIIKILHEDPDLDSTTKLRKSEEMYWIHQLRTTHPRGINQKEDIR